MRRTSLQMRLVPVFFSSSFLTSEEAMSTRKPSQPFSSQKRMMSLIASRVAIAAGWLAGSCQG